MPPGVQEARRAPLSPADTARRNWPPSTAHELRRRAPPAVHELRRDGGLSPSREARREPASDVEGRGGSAGLVGFADSDVTLCSST